MKVTGIFHDGTMYQVEEGRRWWTAKRLPHLPSGWLILNERNLEIGCDTRLGKKILAAIDQGLT